ncbi:penicillin-binding protein 1C [Poritiphilus flavus]|uniref:peptidoglycan glycosyltransferase n=1 Tax=Poritiphilus flavus TaxID=2697053 RepID=A0A6L9ECT3_9FLAO|nr:penicillin-binding protein 1C [Poritiphilus flavus]NAS12517.1 penicillin-binding protein 1C [Poritiphilus flavus]
MGRIRAYLRRHPKRVLVVAILLILYYFSLPRELFKDPTATVVEGRDGQLLGAKIAEDGQWRFPPPDSIPSKMEACLLQFEDAYFYRHPGFNPISILKALKANISAGRVVRGGSTITQQVIRLSRKKRRSYLEKSLELLLATRLELRTSKKEILKLYATHAPYGGNVVGLDAASWRYFGLRPYQLSWAESATLAVLPNAPSLIYPGKNQEKLLKKRNGLLKKLREKGLIDSTTYTLALLEKLPQKPYPLPTTARHFVAFVAGREEGKRIRVSLDENLQKQAAEVVHRHFLGLRQNQVHNAAALIIDVKTRDIKAYIGNTNTTKEHQKDVDMVRANRSTGSTLKPLLYAAMLDAGELLPTMLVPDVPTQIAGYTPENFNEDYTGAIEARKALSRSLNIPSVRLLQNYGLEKFRDQLNSFHLRGISKSADHYGLTLILGGAETNLWDLCKTYAGMASTVNHYTETSSEYYDREFTELVWKQDKLADIGKKTIHKPIFDAGSIYLTLEAMKEVNRPEGNESWEFFDSAKEIAWKTGTSFGNKDAWAIGLTKDHVVGVWVGNADGEGRPQVSGLQSAAPLMFDLFDLLPRSNWFSQPLDALRETAVCSRSGFLPTTNCPLKMVMAPAMENTLRPCSYHQQIFLDQNGQFRLNSSCATLSRARGVSWFVLPPLMEFYYKRRNPTYRSLPPYREDCRAAAEEIMEFIYPRNGSRISLTKNFDGKLNELALKLAHSKSGSKVFWYLDEKYLGDTADFHELGILPKPGKHKITAVDEEGNEKSITITIE